MAKKSLVFLAVVTFFIIFGSPVSAAGNASRDTGSENTENEMYSEKVQAGEMAEDPKGSNPTKGDNQKNIAQPKEKKYILYQLGDNEDKIIQLKRNLIELGYGNFTEPVTSLYDKTMFDAVRNFQISNNLNATGALNEKNIRKMNALIASERLEEKEKDTDFDAKTKEYKTKSDNNLNVTEDPLGEETKLKDTENPHPNGQKRQKPNNKEINIQSTPKKKNDGPVSKVTSKISSKENHSNYSTIVQDSDTLKMGDKNSRVLDLKKNLSILGYGDGIRLTEYYGDGTEKQVRALQKFYRLKVTGVADQATLNKIKFLLPNPLSKGKRHKDTIALKKDLKKIGYGDGILLTDYYGNGTEKQIKAFQKFYKLKVTGVADQATLNKIKFRLPYPLSNGKRHKDTIAFKKDLKKLGYGDGIRLTDYYGDGTEKQVRALQKFYKLKVTGVADQATLNKIKFLLPNPLSNGKRHKDTIALKKDLKKIGYGDGILLTDYYGNGTEKQIKAFQKFYKLKVTGVADQATLNKIKFRLPYPLSNGKRHKDTIAFKKDLKKLGYGDGIRLTDYYGDGTEKQVKRFQKDYGLAITGVGDKATLKAIVNALKTDKEVITYTIVAKTLTQALGVQMKTSPQTDKYMSSPAYVSARYVKVTSSGAYTTADLNVRSTTGTTGHIYGVLGNGSKVNIIKEKNGWYQISYNTWRNAKERDVKEYLDPNKNDKFQHLLLTSSVSVGAGQLNSVLKDKGILAGLGQAFIDGGKKYAVNEAYLISHALLETGNGTSELANGVKYKGKIVYNMFGIGAYDNCAVDCGAKYAYEQGWTTPTKAIVGGAQFVGNNYIHNSDGQNTLYKMRWNPKTPGTHQYATDIGWAVKQVSRLKSIYEQLVNPVKHFDLVKYK